ncbi:UNVERIFIED_ORG: hypothetical protein ABID33_001408 [Xanthobacter viscosus]|jgi:hypothetical protein
MRRLPLSFADFTGSGRLTAAVHIRISPKEGAEC